eukprot:465872_1
MLYKLTVVALLFCSNVNRISGTGDVTDLTTNDIDEVASDPLGFDLDNDTETEDTNVEDTDNGVDLPDDTTDVDNDTGTEDTNDVEDTDTGDDTGDDNTEDDNNDTDVADTDDTNDTDLDTDDTDHDAAVSYDTNDDTDETDDTDDIDDTDDTDDDTDDDLDDDTDDVFDATQSGDSVDNTSSQDSVDNTQSGEGSQESDDKHSQSNEHSQSADSDEDECVGLLQTACGDVASADGGQECGFNKETGECYGIERRAGTIGSGNFDDGYNAARQSAAEEASELYTVVGVLGGVIGALVLIIAGGGYYLYNKNGYRMRSFELEEATRSGQTMSVMDDGHELIQIRTVQDGSPQITK